MCPYGSVFVFVVVVVVWGEIALFYTWCGLTLSDEVGALRVTGGQ